MRELWKVDLDELFHCFSELSSKLFHSDIPAVMIQLIDMEDLIVLYNLHFIDDEKDIHEFKIDRNKTTVDVLNEFNECVHEAYLKDKNYNRDCDDFVKEGLLEFDRFLSEIKEEDESKFRERGSI